MLAAATLELYQQSNSLTCLARTKASLGRVCAALGDTTRLHTEAVDYQDAAAFMQIIETAWQRKPFDLVVVWMHSSGGESLKRLLGFLSWQSRPVKLFHVLGSAAGDPSKKTDAHGFTPGASLLYHQIILGFQLTASGSRWLSHEEMSEGTLRAVELAQDVYTIGTVSPWSARP